MNLAVGLWMLHVFTVKSGALADLLLRKHSHSCGRPSVVDGAKKRMEMELCQQSRPCRMANKYHSIQGDGCCQAKQESASLNQTADDI